MTTLKTPTGDEIRAASRKQRVWAVAVMFLGLVLVIGLLWYMNFTNQTVDAYRSRVADQNAQLAQKDDTIREQNGKAQALYEQLVAAGQEPVTTPAVNGRDGVQGLPGRDATVEDVLKALAQYCANDACKGPQGAAGVNGAAGTSGTDGTPGKDGTPGLNGVNGVNGKDGRGIASVACEATPEGGYTGVGVVTFTDSTTQTVAGLCRPTDTPTPTPTDGTR